MAEAPSETSTQYSIMVNFDQAQQAGTLVHIESADGDEIAHHGSHQAVPVGGA